MDNLRLWGESKLFGQVCKASSDLGSTNQAWLFFPTNSSLALSVLVSSTPDNSPTYMSHIPS